MMEEGEPEVHTTELTALSAAEKIVTEDELTTPLTSIEGHDFVMEVQPGITNHSETVIQHLMENQQQQLPPARFQPFFKTISADSSFLPTTIQDPRAFFFPTLTSACSDNNSSSLLSSLPQFSSSKRSSLEFTAAWVASTPFSDAPATPSLSAPVEDDLGGEGGGGEDGVRAESPQFVAIENPVTTTTSASKSMGATMVGSMSGRKIRPTTTNMMGIALQQRQQHLQSQIDGKVEKVSSNPTQFMPNHQPQFITPTFSVTRFPTSGQSAGNNATPFVQPTSAPFFVPTVNGGEGNVEGGQRNLPVFDPSATSNHLGRHWKQMGCHTRQYVQPSIPLPASIRLASAAKQLRVAGKGATSLGGPPGSLSPLTPNKSWAQVVASTPQQKKQHQQQQPRQTSIINTSESVNTNVSLFSGQQQQQHSKIITPLPGIGYNKVAAMPPPPLFTGNVGGGKPVKSASLRGLEGLGGVSTSSNRDFKSLLLRLKTVLEKEKVKWRPKAFVSGFGGVDGGNGVATEAEATSLTSSTFKPCRESIDGKQRDECIFWLAWIQRKLQFSAETMALSVALFDALISYAGKVESSPSSSPLIVTAANCKLVALVCLLLSAKFSEEDADVPTTKDFLRVSEINNASGTGGSEGAARSVVITVEMALKMERVILTALEWDLNRPTPLKFLEILHTLLLCHQPQLLEDVALNLTPAKHLQRLTWKMQKIVANHQLALSYRPAVLAVSLLSVDLESIGVADWQVVSNALEKICQIGHLSNLGDDRHKISRCKNLIVRLLAGVDRNLASKETTSGGSNGVVVSTQSTKAVEDQVKEKRSMVKLKRKHVPSESGGGGFANVASGTGSNAFSTLSAATISSTTSSTSSTTSSRTTLKRVFSIAESPTCKSEARSDEEARGGLSAAERFQALQGLCINIY